MNKELFDKGMKMRREVLGDEYVDRSLANADDFVMPLQELTTQYCWGEIWCRTELSHRERSLINLGMLSAMNRQQELKLHVRAALRNGVTKEQIRAVILQVAVYCGMPAAADAIRTASSVLKEEEAA